MTRYREELAKYVCFGYINPVFEDAMRDTPEESRWTDTISVCTDTTTNNFIIIYVFEKIMKKILHITILINLINNNRYL